MLFPHLTDEETEAWQVKPQALRVQPDRWAELTVPIIL